MIAQPAAGSCLRAIDGRCCRIERLSYGFASELRRGARRVDSAAGAGRDADRASGRTSGFDYLEIFYKEKLLLLAIFLIFVCSAYLYARVSPTRYEATLVLSPAAQNFQASGGAAGALASLGLGGGIARSNQKSVALALLELLGR